MSSPILVERSSLENDMTDLVIPFINLIQYHLEMLIMRNKLLPNNKKLLPKLRFALTIMKIIEFLFMLSSAFIIF
ncbi:hypothetical protein VCB84_000200 [Providencia rettgeri]|nr:hypothetical protein [Providencia rettgeri]ELR5100994.1 hypothetical protein [Providencia rettgeri]ELR5268115.1 hypothetical protein [Providencia rettgeri]EMC2739678.1 hypothetical protein [Providencia rettgeri]EMD6656835.1 hypothetical protein [Providencia rettgeri]